MAVTCLLLVHTGLLAYSAYVHSPTLNEPGHLVAGLSNWKFGRFDVYSVNPPLVRMVAALPVMAAGYEEDWSGFYTGPGARPEFSMGEDFVAANGERSFFLFMIARWACIPFSWIGAIVCYLWARDLYGRPAGVIACSIWCFEPNILAHASLMTPDAHATALGLAACYTFWRWLKKPTWTQAALTGVVLGLAELAKTTLILFYPLWPLMWIVYRLAERRSVAISLREMTSEHKPRAEREAYKGRMTARDWLREAGMLAMRMAIGLYILNLGYGFEGSLKPLGKFHFVSNLLTGQESGDKRQESEDRVEEAVNPKSKIQNPQSTNRFANTWLAAIPVPFPANYLVGIDLQQRDFDDYGRPSYLRGEWRDRGWWYYYLYATAIKVPLGLWALGVFTLVQRLRRNSAAPFRDEFILLAPALIVITVVSSKTGFSEHMRYVLPSFPFVFVWITSFYKNFVDNEDGDAIACARRTTGGLAITLSSFFLFWSFASCLWIFPHTLSYFNESVGGPRNGPRHLLGSNVDWGQDFLYLRSWLNEHAANATVYLAFHGNIDPSQVGFAKSLPWPPRLPSVNAGGGKNLAGNDLEVGFYAISVNILWGTAMAARDGVRSTHSTPVFAYAQAKKREPADSAGYSIYVFR